MSELGYIIISITHSMSNETPLASLRIVGVPPDALKSAECYSGFLPVS